VNKKKGVDFLFGSGGYLTGVCYYQKVASYPTDFERELDNFSKGGL